MNIVDRISLATEVLRENSAKYGLLLRRVSYYPGAAGPGKTALFQAEFQAEFQARIAPYVKAKARAAHLERKRRRKRNGR